MIDFKIRRLDDYIDILVSIDNTKIDLGLHDYHSAMQIRNALENARDVLDEYLACVSPNHPDLPACTHL